MEYEVKNWRTFQHYRDRNPPWIKLHFSLLSSEDWVMLSDAERVLAIACMLIASKNDGRVDCSDKGATYLQRVAYISKRPNFKPLIDIGFLVPASGCKQMLADARPETETETETETEKSFAPTREKAPRSKPEFVRFVNGSEDPIGHFEVDKAIRLQWLEAYPAVQIGTELEKAAAWVVANPTKRKKDWRRFLNNWMSRCQEKAR